jgi:hypothetical protein
MRFPGQSSNAGALNEWCDTHSNGYSGTAGTYSDMVDGTHLTTAEVCVWNRTTLINCATVNQ